MSSLLPFFSLLQLLPALVLAQTGGNLTVGATLIANQNSSSWHSPSGEFAFGFQKLANTNNDFFLLAIWYDRIQEKTIVWYANGDRPASTGSKLELTAKEGLVLTGPQGGELWRSEGIGGPVASAAMTDTGNLVVRDGAFMKLWESFKHPRDTILPSQVLERGVPLFSRQSDTNFSKGRFQLLLQNDGNLEFATVNLPSTYANEPYYESGTKGDSKNLSSPGKQLVFNKTGYLYVLKENGEVHPLTNYQISSVAARYAASTSGYYVRATLNFDGVFMQYLRPKTSLGNESWAVFWYAPDNICLSSFVSAGSGTCGLNSVCRLNAENRPTCECVGGYSLLDPDDPYSSCKPNYTQRCGDDDGVGPPEELYAFEELPNTDWDLSNYAILSPFTEDLCRQSCLHDCMCAVAIFRFGNMCWKKKLPLSNGKVDPNLNGKAFVKVRKGHVSPRIPLPPGAEAEKQGKDKNDFVLARSALLVSSFIGNFLLVTAICLGFFFICRKKIKPVPCLDNGLQTNICRFTYKNLVEATIGFEEELGRGAFGVVYKGSLQRMGCHTLVAVKKLHTIMQDSLREFRTEVDVIGQTHHKNLVRLLGFCDEGEQKLLVYEFLSNGALSGFLFGDLIPSWEKRVQIAFGIARGLLYLHEECRTQIIHCDIKPQNILLDEYYNVRISDFGLSKPLLLDQSKTRTAIRGTKGYVAPEWFRNLPITVKVDVYSFGVLLLEIICCRRSADINENKEERAILTDWAYDCYIGGAVDVLVEHDKEAIGDKARLERFVMVAIWCIQEDPSRRPTMRQVIQMLEGIVKVSVPPCPCPFTGVTESFLSDAVTNYG